MSLDTFLDQIAESPDDEALRQVFRDWLLERGDPRGDFMALQLQRTNPKRQDSLLRKHFAEWMAELAPLVHRPEVRFEHGCLVRCTIGKPKGPTLRLPDVAPVIGHRVLATVRELLPLRVDPVAYEAVIVHPAMRSLRALTVHDAKLLARISTRPEPWRVDALTCEVIRKDLTADRIAVVDASSAFPQLRTFTLALKFTDDGHFGSAPPDVLAGWDRQLASLTEAFARSPLLDRLSRVGVHLVHRDDVVGLGVVRAIALLDRVASVRVESYRLDAVLTGSRSKCRCAVTVRPHGEYAIARLREQVAAIPNLELRVS